MSNACTPILVGVTSSVSEISLLSKTAKFLFRPMDYRNRPKKFMQIGVDVKCMHTNFGGRDFSGFRDIATFRNGQISLSTMDYIVHGHQKI